MELLLMIKNIFLFIFFIIISISGLRAEETGGGTKYGILIDLGLGFANNLRLADRLNARSDFYSAALNANAEKKEPVLYAGLDIEPRIFFEKLVLAPSFGFYSVSGGTREINSASGKYSSELKLNVAALRLSLYYKIDTGKSSYILLGGGMGLYSSTIEEKESYRNDVTPAASFNVSDKDKRGTLGWHSVIEYNYMLGSVPLSVGLMSRFVEFYSFRVNEDRYPGKFSGGLTGIFLYIGTGYIF
jgi:hypothetical protein